MLVCYGGVSLPVSGIRLLSAATGPQVADLVFAALLCVLSLAALLTNRRYGRG